MATREEIDKLIATAVEADLAGLDFLAEFDYATIERGYNGIGPEWAGEAVRETVTQYLAIFEPAAVIHDLRNEFSDGTRYAFNYANMEFLANCRRLADRRYAWYNWRRYRARAVAGLCYDFVSGPGGWKAWREAAKKKGKIV